MMVKWIIKHGLGSPGATAKAMTKDYLRTRLEHPHATEEELLFAVLFMTCPRKMYHILC